MFCYPIAYPDPDMQALFSSKKSVSSVPLTYDWSVVKRYLKKKEEGALLRFYIPGFSKEIQMCRFRDNILFVKDFNYQPNQKYENILVELMQLAKKYNVPCVPVPATNLTAKAMREALLVYSVTNLI